MPTRGRSGRLLAVLAGVSALVVAGVAAPAQASSRIPRPAPTTTTAPAPVMPKSWILVDADTGKVLDAHDEHTRRRPASTIKLLTVLTALQHLPSSADVTASALAASMPARKMGFAAGTTWPLDDMVASAMIVSANDAAVALGEASAGSLDAFAVQLRATAQALGLVDEPVLEDPAGLDDEFAHGGGDWISAWDLAIVGRAAWRVPRLRTIAAEPIVRFTDPDGKDHRLVNHNRLLTDYEGGNGLKPGYTRQAGNTFVGTATRGGRTMLVVVLDAPDLYTPMQLLFDKGFAIAASAETGPMLPVRALAAPAQPEVARRAAAVGKKPSTSRSTSFGRDAGQWVALAAAAVALSVVELRRRRAHRR